MRNNLHKAVGVPISEAGRLNHLGVPSRRSPYPFCALRCFITP